MLCTQRRSQQPYARYLNGTPAPPHTQSQMFNIKKTAIAAKTSGDIGVCQFVSQ